MKKTISVVLVCLLALCLVACGSKEKEGADQWKISGVEAMGQAYTMAEFEELAASIGMDTGAVGQMKIDMQGDGTLVMDFIDEEGAAATYTGTWAKTDTGYTLTMDGDDLEAPTRADGNELVLDLESFQLIFTKV